MKLFNERRLILARHVDEKATVPASIAARPQAMDAVLDGLANADRSVAGLKTAQRLQQSLARFWQVGAQKLALIQADRKPEALAYLIEQTIPARNALLAQLAGAVRNLARRRVEAAREIKGLTGTSTKRVEQGARLAGQAGCTIGELLQCLRRVADIVGDIVGDISAPSTARSAGVLQLGQTVGQTAGQVDSATGQNSALVTQCAAAAAALRQQARSLLAVVNTASGGRGPSRRFDPALACSDTGQAALIASAGSDGVDRIRLRRPVQPLAAVPAMRQVVSPPAPAAATAGRGPPPERDGA